MDGKRASYPAQQRQGKQLLPRKQDTGDGERQADPRACIAFSDGVPGSATLHDELKACGGLATWWREFGGTKALATLLAASKHIEVLREIMFAPALFRV